MTPLRLFRRVAVAEAITWALLLSGMALKYSGVTELGVRVCGMVHGVVFIAYCLGTLLVAVDQRWSRGRTLLALVASVPPFCTVLADRSAHRRARRAGVLGDVWRLTSAPPATLPERVAAWLLRHPGRGALAGVVAVLALTGLALVAGPPVG